MFSGLCFFRMANSGRTIILSIHQPRYSIYRLFDSLTLLVNGKQVPSSTRIQILISDLLGSFVCSLLSFFYCLHFLFLTLFFVVIICFSHSVWWLRPIFYYFILLLYNKYICYFCLLFSLLFVFIKFCFTLFCILFITIFFKLILQK